MNETTNNKTEYTLEDLRVVQFDEPTILPEPIILPNAEKGEEQIKKDYTDYMGDESRMYAFIPLIEINKGYRVNPSNIMKFKLDLNSFMPRVSVKVTDPNAELKSKYYPTDGSIMGIYIAPMGEDNNYKAIRLDFIITSVKETSSIPGTVLSETVSEFEISGELNVPEMFYNRNCYESGTSWEALRSVAGQTGLGFVSNIENTQDSQIWLNGYSSVRNFTEYIAKHSYLDDKSFFVSFIDAYYNLNLIEVSRLFSQNPENEKCWAYTTASYEEENADANAEADTEAEEDEDFMKWNGRRHKWWYELNNSKYLSAWTPYFDNYKEKNSNSSSLFDGYTKYMQSWNWSKREKVELPLSIENPGTEGMLPLNKGHIIDGEPSELSKNMVSYTYMGETNEHMNPEYYFAEANNQMNLTDINKFGLTVELPCVNPAITRYTRIKVIVFEKNDNAQAGLTENPDMRADVEIERDDGKTLKLSDYPELQSDTTPRFDLTTEEGIEQAKAAGVYSELATAGADGEVNAAGETINESLSGWYVVTGYEIYMDDIDSEGGTTRLKEKINLARREYKPALKSNYEKTNNDK